MCSDWQLFPRNQEEGSAIFQSFPHGSGPTIKQGLLHLIEADSTVFLDVEGVKIHNQEPVFFASSLA
jgi:hypothetical protein